MGRVERQHRLGRLQQVVKRRAALLGGPFRQTNEVGGFEGPCWSSEHTCASNVVERSCDEPQVSQHIPHEGMFEDRQFRYDKGGFAPGQFFYDLVPVPVLSVEHRKIFPAMARLVKTLE